MKLGELRESTDEELSEELHRLAKEQFNLRLQRATGQLGQTHLIGQTRREIARVKTVLFEKEKEKALQSQLASQSAESESNG